jgi:hypothetical protein
VLVDGPLIARVDHASGDFLARWFELARDLPGNPQRVDVARFGGATAIVTAGAPAERWMNSVVGLTPADAGEVDAIVAWYGERGVSPRFELCPCDGFDGLAAVLANVGAMQTGFIGALVGAAAAPTGATAAGVDVRVVEPGGADVATFASVLLGGHEVGPDTPRSAYEVMERWVAEPTVRCYLASVDGRALGAAILGLRTPRMGYLANASTLPEGRRQGCHSALLARRLRDAADAGCDAVCSLANVASTSAQNMQRAGLHPAFTKVFWDVAAPPLRG